MRSTNSKHYFLKGGGEMGELIRAKDWSKTSLGDPANWPSNLRTTLGILLNTKFPMFLWWGTELTCFYNDAYRPSLGKDGKHPSILGMPAKEAWPEIWDIIKPLIDKVVYEEESIWFEDMLVPIYRNGKIEDVYWTFSYSPVPDNDKVGGVLVTCTETTEKVNTLRKIEESDEKLRSLIKSAPFPIGVYTGKEMRIEVANESIIKAWGKGNDVKGKLFNEVMPELEGQEIFEQLDEVFTSGIPFHAYNKYLTLIIDGRERPYYYNYSFTPLFDSLGKVYGVMNTASDVTELNLAKQKTEEGKRLYEAITQNTPDLIYVWDLNYRFTYANEALLKMWGRTWDDSIGKSLLEVGYEPWHAEMHEREIDQVIATKKTVRGEVSFPHATLGRRIYDYILVPVIDQNNNVVAIAGTTRDITQLVEARKQIEESEQNIRSMVLQSPIGICVMDAATLVSEIVNDSFIEIAGKTYEQIAGKHYWDTFAEAKPYYESALSKVIEQGESYYANEVEMMLIRHGKEEIIYVTFVYAPLKDIEGVVKKVAVWVLDNTPQVITRQKIEEADKRFRSTVKQAPVGITILRGPKYVVEMANDAYLQLVGRNEETFVGRALFDSLPEVQETVHPLLNSVLNTGVPYHGNEVAIPLNRYGKQGIYYFDFLYHPLKEEDGKISGIIVTVTEVSEKVEARKKIEESEKQFRSLAESLPQLVWETDDKGNALFASARWKEYTGIMPAGEAEWKAMIHPDDLEENAQTWIHSLATGDLYRSDVRIKSKQGDYRWHTVIGEPVFEKENKILKWVGAFTDIHTEKAFTHELEKQVTERTKELEDTNIELGKMNKDLESFAYISSHDLQEPLRKIQTFSTQIMEREFQNLSESGKDKFRRMENAANRMQTLIDDLLIYSQTNTKERKFEKVHLFTIMEEVKEDLKEELQQKSATIEFDAMCEANIIPFQFRQLLFNLINNSLKFSNPKEASHIKIKSAIADGATFNHPKLAANVKYCHLSVSDNGIGFEQEYSEKIFEVFQRLHSKTQYKGTGIGLSIVKRIVENHNGIITAKGELNKGATFDIYIPVT